MKKSPSTLTLTLILGVLCVLLAASVFAVNSITSSIITTSEQAAEQAAFNEVVPDADDFIEVTDQAGDDPSILFVYEAKAGGETIAFLYKITTNGYAGAIENLVAIDTQTDTVKAIKILSHSETPGLGANASTPEFQNSFQGLSLSPITVVKNGAVADNNEIDAITASTITTNAVAHGVNIAIDNYLANFSGDSESSGNNQQTKEDIFKEIVSDADTFTEVTAQSGNNESILSVHEAKSGDETLAFLYVVSTQGYADAILNLIAIDTQTNTIKAIRILSQAETPGLRTKITEPEFENLFKGLPLTSISVVREGADTENNEIDAITRATITTSAVTGGINIAIEDFLANFNK